MSKNYTFSDCVSFACDNNIAFNFYYTDDSSTLYCDISDGYDGYLTATQAIFEYDYFTKSYNAHMNLNIRYALKKDYEFMRRMEIAINRHRRDTLQFCRATWNAGLTTWRGALCFNNEHYIAAASIHGNGVWHD